MFKKFLGGSIIFVISQAFIRLDLAVASVIHHFISGVNTPTALGYLSGALLSFYSTPALATYLLKDRNFRADALTMSGYIGVILMSVYCLLCLPFQQYLTACYAVLFAVMYLFIIRGTEQEKLV